MLFCGRCGLLLNADTIRCPRCGTATDFDPIMPAVPTHTDDATIMTHVPQPGHNPSLPLQSPASYPSFPGPGNDNTSIVYPGQETYSTREAYSIPRSASLGQTPPAANTYPTPGNFQPGFNPTTTDPGPQFPISPTPRHKTQTWVVICSLLLVLLLVIGAAGLFMLNPSRFIALFGGKNIAATSTTLNTPTTQASPTAQPSPTTLQAARETVYQYYHYINLQDYESAYNLWLNSKQTLSGFKQGFAHTHRDTITFGDTTLQTDGTVQVYLTIDALEDNATGTSTQHTGYKGYYIVQQQSDGSWKLITGNIQST